MPEVIFLIEDAPDGGFTARALGVSICTQTETMAELRTMAREDVACHFDPADAPRVIRLHYVRDEVLVA